MLYLFGSKSKSKRTISRELKIPCIKFLRNAIGGDVVVYYGVDRSKTGESCKDGVHRINSNAGINKLKALRIVEKAGVKTPESKTSLSLLDKKEQWIEKRNFSSKGFGICLARGRGKIDGKYYQKFVAERKFELRVHAFSWLPEKDWSVHKRMGSSDKIAWNFHQGGHFRSVKNPNVGVFWDAKKAAAKVLKTLNMSFGAVDFIVDESMGIFFIEINSSPGFTDFSKSIYIGAFEALKKMELSELEKLV